MIKDLNGAWLALGVAAVGAVGALGSGRGSMARPTPDSFEPVISLLKQEKFGSAIRLLREIRGDVNAYDPLWNDLGLVIALADDESYEVVPPGTAERFLRTLGEKHGL